MPDEVIRSGGEPHFPAGVTVVIGGSGGVGRACCQRFAEHGSDVALTYHANADKAAEAVALVEAAGQKGHAAALDMTDADAVQAFFDDVIARFGHIHTVVYALGADISMSYVAEIDGDEWNRTIDSDLNGFFHVMRAALPHMRTVGGASFVAMTSAGLVRHPARDILSTVPKAGIEALMRGIAREEGRYGVRGNSVALGVIDAGLFHRLAERLPDGFIDAMKKNTALRRFGTAREAADAAVFLASSAGSFITGHSLVLDGGYAV